MGMWGGSRCSTSRRTARHPHLGRERVCAPPGRGRAAGGGAFPDSAAGGGARPRLLQRLFVSHTIGRQQTIQRRQVRERNPATARAQSAARTQPARAEQSAAAGRRAAAELPESSGRRSQSASGRPVAAARPAAPARPVPAQAGSLGRAACHAHEIVCSTGGRPRYAGAALRHVEDFARGGHCRRCVACCGRAAAQGVGVAAGRGRLRSRRPARRRSAGSAARRSGKCGSSGSCSTARPWWR